MSKENRVSDERLAEMARAYSLSPYYAELCSALRELQSLRSKPVAGATLSSAIEGLKIALDAHDEEVRYQASIEGEAAEFWDDIEVKVDDVRVVLAALGAQVSAPTLEPASPQPEAVITEMVERIKKLPRRVMETDRDNGDVFVSLKSVISALTAALKEA